MLDHMFYLDDCMMVGLLPGPNPRDLQKKATKRVFSVLTRMSTSTGAVGVEFDDSNLFNVTYNLGFK